VALCLCTVSRNVLSSEQNICVTILANILKVLSKEQRTSVSVVSIEFPIFSSLEAWLL
jgi:hypothetical protein